MGKEQSVAPKERINIVYKPATGDMEEEVELPLKLIMLGDFTLREDADALEDRKTINIDKDNFEDVIKGQKLNLKFNAKDTLTEGADEEDSIAVDLKINSMKDFEPESVANQIPETKKLLGLRDALTGLKGDLANKKDFIKKINSILEDDTSREALMKELGLGAEGGGDGDGGGGDSAGGGEEPPAE